MDLLQALIGTTDQDFPGRVVQVDQGLVRADPLVVRVSVDPLLVLETHLMVVSHHLTADQGLTDLHLVEMDQGGSEGTSLEIFPVRVDQEMMGDLLRLIKTLCMVVEAVEAAEDGEEEAGVGLEMDLLEVRYKP